MVVTSIVALSVSILSACASACAAIIANSSLRSQRYSQSWITNHDLLTRAEIMLVNNPDLLQLHGIQVDDLSDDSISPEELMYIAFQIDAASAWHKLNGDKCVTLTTYRKNFLQNVKVRTAWKKYLRGRLFLIPTPFSEAVDLFISEIEEHAQTEPRYGQHP